MTLNDWQRKAQERWPHEAVWFNGWQPAGRHEVADYDLPPNEFLSRLAYERQKCERCFGYKTNRWRHPAVDECLDCDGTGLSSDYRKAQEFAVELGLAKGAT